MKTVLKTIQFETMPRYTRGLFQMRNSRKLVIPYINTTTHGLHSSPQPVLSTDPEIPYPGIPACVFHLAAFYDTGRERDLGSGSFIGMTGWKQMTAMKNIPSKLTGYLISCDLNNRVMKNTMPFSSNGGYGDKCARTPVTRVIALSSWNYCTFRVGKLAG